MKLKRLLSLTLAAVAVAGVCALAACGNSSVAGKTYTFSKMTLDTTEWDEAGITLPTDEKIASDEEKLSVCYIAFNKDGTFSSCIPSRVMAAVTTYEPSGYYSEDTKLVYLADTEEHAAMDGGSFMDLHKDGSKLCYTYLYDAVSAYVQEEVNGFLIDTLITYNLYCTIYFAA